MLYYCDVSNKSLVCRCIKATINTHASSHIAIMYKKRFVEFIVFLVTKYTFLCTVDKYY